MGGATLGKPGAHSRTKSMPIVASVTLAHMSTRGRALLLLWLFTDAANDNNFNGNFFAGSVTLTRTDPQAWWQVGD